MIRFASRLTPVFTCILMLLVLQNVAFSQTTAEITSPSSSGPFSDGETIYVQENWEGNYPTNLQLEVVFRDPVNELTYTTTTTTDVIIIPNSDGQTGFFFGYTSATKSIRDEGRPGGLCWIEVNQGPGTFLDLHVITIE